MTDLAGGWDPTVTPDPQLEEPPALIYASADKWVREWLLAVVRPTRPGNWCAKWWAHPEAAARLGDLWAAWEAAQAEGGAGPSQWWTYHFAVHWEALRAPTGPFAQCSPDQHTPPADRLPAEPVPEPDGER